MERGVHATGWLHRRWNYHPSLPYRSTKMLEDMTAYHATILLWPCMGGGAISLPWLEHEISGEVDARLRFNGFMNDGEFVRSLRARGIKAFGVIFSVQGWEFPVELAKDGSLLSVNVLRNEGTRAWLGLREFSQNAYPTLWKPFEHYFPQGLTNSAGERVHDLWEEACARDAQGKACRATWLEMPGHDHQCRFMDRNNPVWHEYLLRQARMLIDAGVSGIQFDEPDTPFGSIAFGGCFCRDCMDGFARHLEGISPGRLPESLRGVSLADFHYGRWLHSQGFQPWKERDATPLFFEYVRYLQRRTVETFRSLVSDVRSYAQQQGREVLIGANTLAGLDRFIGMVPHLDIVMCEQAGTRERQPASYRQLAALAGDLPTAVVMNPYGGVLPEIVDDLNRGLGQDRYQRLIYEAAAFGVSLSIPYGAWMGFRAEDAFYAPHELNQKVASFLHDQDASFSPSSFAEIAVIRSPESEMQAAESGASGMLLRELFHDVRWSVAETPYCKVVARLADSAQPFDVVYFHDGHLREDDATDARLAQYKVVILPEARWLSEHQTAALHAHLKRGGQVMALSTWGLNLREAERRALSQHAGFTGFELEDARWTDRLRAGLQVHEAGEPVPSGDLGIHIQRVGPHEAAIHVINYAYDEPNGVVPRRAAVRFTVRLPGTFVEATCASPDSALRASVVVDKEGHHAITLEDLHIYGIVTLRHSESGAAQRIA